MGHSPYDPTASDRRAWNAGKKVGTKRPLKPRQVWAIRFFLDREQRLRDRALFDLAIDSKLRGCDLVKIKIGTLVLGPEIRTRAMVVQQKTGRPVQFELMSDTRYSLLAWLERRGGTVDDYAFPSRIDPKGHVSTRQYARLVDEWVVSIGLSPREYGTIRCGAPKRRSFTRRQVTSALFRFCWATPKSRSQSGILVSTWKMPSNSPRPQKSNGKRLHFRMEPWKQSAQCRPERQVLRLPGSRHLRRPLWRSRLRPERTSRQPDL